MTDQTATPIELTHAISDARDAALTALVRASALVDRFPDDAQKQKMFEAAKAAADLADAALAVKNRIILYSTKP
jgi:hypothetical protein